MEDFSVGKSQESFDVEKSPMREAYLLLGAKTPLELSNLYAAEDQKLMPKGWDYNNPELITNRIKEILEATDPHALTDEENEWRNNILWFWYHHAISCAIWRYKDKAAAQMYSARALEFQSEDHPNKITRLFYFLTRDQLEEAEKWAETIAEEPEKSTSTELLEEYRRGQFYTSPSPLPSA
jgi:hypothetical protein